MEALQSRLTTGEQSGGHEQPQPESPLGGPPKPKSPSQNRQTQQTRSQQARGQQQQTKQPKRQHLERKRLRQQRQSIDSDTLFEEGKHADATSKRMGRTSPGIPAPSSSNSTQSTLARSMEETQEGTPKQKRERKPQRPGKYVCSYCGRACAKPSVLQKHIRSHTGERPYPCAPCGFSFKTKSNLYKHRKSHTHRVKAGLASGAPSALEEPITESEDEARQPSSASSSVERQGSVASQKTHDTERSTELSQGKDDSFAVKKRLAMRLSRGKRGPIGSSDEITSSLVLGSKGSTESGYFSRSESTEQSQDSPPNTSAKSYAEIILGKYGRLGHLQRMSRHHNQQPSGQEEKNIPFTVPKKQVIDHITKLITINEAVVDTSMIDSVKPRRFSLSRKSSTESQKVSCVKEPVVHSPNAGDPGFKSSGSITMGVPCEKFHHQSLNVDPLAGQTSTAPLLRSLSMPSAASSTDASSVCPRSFRLSQSFDERQPCETQASRRFGMLRRQPAVKVPPGAEFTKEELQSSHTQYHQNMSTVPDHKKCHPEPYECEACGIGCKDWEGYKIHKRSLCLTRFPQESETPVCQMDKHPHLLHHTIRPGALAMRKRRKEESFEFDDPSSPFASSPPTFSPSAHGRDESSVAYEGPSRTSWSRLESDREGKVKVCSVIQHTSSFEKQETLFTDNQNREEAPQKQPEQQSAKSTPRKLVRQHNVQVPEILVTEDSNTNVESVSLSENICITKQIEKADEFQWPTRSPTLAQLPIEKLPPKKKRLRLAELAQSSGESSFDSISLPRSPSQDSSASYTSSRSASFEESNRSDMETTPLRRSRAPHMLTVPGLHHHHHREMRRSASEQAPHDPQQSVLMAETMRSKSFDYSSLSPERSAAGWRERRKCLLMRHMAVRDPEEEEQPTTHATLKVNPSHSSPSPPDPLTSSTSSRPSPGLLHPSLSPGSPLSGEIMSCNKTRTICPEPLSQWKLSQSIQLKGNSDVLPTQSPTPAPPLRSGEPFSISLQPFQPHPTQCPSGAARAHYHPMSTGLKLEIPNEVPDGCSESITHPSQILHPQSYITISQELLRPTMSPTVAVRLQADTPTPAGAIYTTLSQSTALRPQEPVGSVLNNITIPMSQYKSHLAMTLTTGSQIWSEEGFRSSVSGGNKRVLSPSSSVELSPESQQQQKRVKEEEEEGEERCVEREVAETSQKEKEERQTCMPSICSSVSQNIPPFTTLQSTTSCSWCYLNYIKPNPFPFNEHQPSVYSSWSTSEYNPNPPGLSSKMALSVVYCKQRCSPSIYTMSPMSSTTTETQPETSYTTRPCTSEVCATQPRDSSHAEPKEDEQSAKDNGPKKEREEEEAEKEAQSTNKCREPPRIWICEGGYRSNEEYVYVRGRGRGRYMCEECGIRCKKPSMLRKHIRLHTDARPFVCKHCNFAFKTKGNLTKHMKSKAHGKKCHQGATAGSFLEEADAEEGGREDCSVLPETREEHQFSDLDETDEEDDDDDDEDDNEDDDEEESWSRDDPHTTPTGSLRPSNPQEHREPECSQSHTLNPKTSTHGCYAASPSTKRALFSSTWMSPEGEGCPSQSPSPSPVRHLSSAHTLSPKRDLPPLRSPSSKIHLSPALYHPSSPSSLSPSGCHASPSRERQPSPVQALSLIRPRSSSSGPPGSPDCLPGSSAQHRTCLPRDTPSNAPKDRPSTATSKERLLKTQSVQDEVRVPYFSPRPGLPREANRVLSHLPLHSQQLVRAPSIMIPIGGIHMIQPRTSPLYSLVRSPMSAQGTPSQGGMDRAKRAGLSKAPLGWSSLLQRQDSVKESGPSMHTSSQDHRVREGEASGTSQSGLPSHRGGMSHVCLSTRKHGSLRNETKLLPSGSVLDGSSHTDTQTSTLSKGATHTHITESRSTVFPETTQGQKTPSFRPNSDGEEHLKGQCKGL